MDLEMVGMHNLFQVEVTKEKGERKK